MGGYMEIGRGYIGIIRALRTFLGVCVCIHIYIYIEGYAGT